MVIVGQFLAQVHHSMMLGGPSECCLPCGPSEHETFHAGLNSMRPSAPAETARGAAMRLTGLTRAPLGASPGSKELRVMDAGVCASDGVCNKHKLSLFSALWHLRISLPAREPMLFKPAWKVSCSLGLYGRQVLLGSPSIQL